jgi:hypothetical protein
MSKIFSIGMQVSENSLIMKRLISDLSSGKALLVNNLCETSVLLDVDHKLPGMLEMRSVKLLSF